MNRITTGHLTSFFQQKSIGRSKSDKAKKWLIVFALIIGQVLATSTQAAGERVVANERLPFNALIYNECTNELVSFEGIFHQVIKTWTGKDGTVYWRRDINAHGNGQGVDSGNRYIWNDTYQEIVTTPDPNGCAVNFSNPYRLRLTSKGKLPNQQLEVNYTAGFNENCQFFENLEVAVKCVG
jgi:hypothetical protein